MNMQNNYFLRSIFLAIALCVISWFTVPLSFAADNEAKAASSNSNLTPLPGNPQRKAILDALRAELKRLHGMDLLFVVQYLKVKDGWAWVDALPQSPDAQQHYEDVSALLQLQNGLWKLVELPCTEVENPECLGDPGYFAGLMQRFPGVPAEIFPVESGEAGQSH
jgi:hypothetical protein